MFEIPTGLFNTGGLGIADLESGKLPVQSWQNKDGTRVSFVQVRGLPKVDVNLIFNAGTVTDESVRGVATMTHAMLGKGSIGLSASAFEEGLYDVGAELEEYVSLEFSTFNLRSLSDPECLLRALSLLTTKIAQPEFEPRKLKQLQERVSRRKADEDYENEINPSNMRDQLLYAGHPYSRFRAHSIDWLALTSDDLRRYHRGHYCASNLEVTVVGNLDSEQAADLVDSISRALPHGEISKPLPALPRSQGARLHLEKPDSMVSVSLTLPVHVPANHDDHVPMRLARQVLGVGRASRLRREMQRYLGSTFLIHAYLPSNHEGGPLQIAWDIEPQWLQASISLAQDIISSFIEQGPTTGELEQACRSLIIRKMTDLSANRPLVDQIIGVGHVLPNDYLSALPAKLASCPPAAVHDMIKRRFDLSRAIIISTGPTVEQQALTVIEAG
ncbi:M16 family metallopeptidase [Pseudomonas parafulva]|uniref:M16 family metallopeptidase n=1 Tax=Pseudomonas parafulva TaxID=157782 RepID=UPI0007347084|nr:insulinase family protein [Pseudomonas parafulva]KTS93285.1 hypothetical protein NS212_18365 [Pseudomonas parafulva]